VRVVGAAFCAAGLLVVPLASAATFGRPAEIPLVRAPTAVVEVDATGDGIEDVVVANANGRPTLTVLPGKEDGSFGTPLVIGVGLAAQSLAVADFDNDGADDLAVAGDGEIAMYYSAEGTLIQRAILSVPDVSSVRAVDLDLDGNLDVVAASATRSSLTVFMGTGENTFLPGREYASGTDPAAVLIADLNGDELPDVVVGGNAMAVLFNNGDGTLSAPVSIPGAPSHVLALAAEDLDGDGDVDLVVAHPNLATVMINAGDGQFHDFRINGVGVTPTAIGIAFLDDDSNLDIVTANRGTNDVSILHGIGNGRFQAEERVKVGKGPVGLALEDLNADGLNDLVTANRQARSVPILLNGTDAPQPVVCLVPRVARRTLAVARRLVAAAHCKVASVPRTYSRRVKKGKVISVTPAPGARRPVDTPVTRLVSRGRKPKR
jgi:hypothetical protein